MGHPDTGRVPWLTAAAACSQYAGTRGRNPAAARMCVTSQVTTAAQSTLEVSQEYPQACNENQNTDALAYAAYLSLDRYKVCMPPRSIVTHDYVFILRVQVSPERATMAWTGVLNSA